MKKRRIMEMLRYIRRFLNSCGYFCTFSHSYLNNGDYYTIFYCNKFSRPMPVLFSRKGKILFPTHEDDLDQFFKLSLIHFTFRKSKELTKLLTQCC